MSDSSPEELPESLRLSGELLSILNEIASKDVEERRRILRPHDDAGMGPGDGDIMLLRARLDMALSILTHWEIACQLSLYNFNDTGTEAYLAVLAPGLLVLIKDDAFLRYLAVYLYFGIRMLAGRIAPLPWWEMLDSDDASDGRNRLLEGPNVNKRPLQLAVPPPAANWIDNRKALDDFHALDSALPDESHVALRFLDGFHPDALDPRRFDPDEPAEFDLWLRDLRPGISPERAERFQKIQDGLALWARQRAHFYIQLEPPDVRAQWEPPDGGLRRRPKDGWVITNAVSARLALADFYWLARLLHAEVSANGRVSYSGASWMHVLRFHAVLHRQEEKASLMRDDEEVLRSVFAFVCDLIQNAVELTDERERRHFQPREFPEPPDNVRTWRAVFDEELRELEEQKNRREYRPSDLSAASFRHENPQTPAAAPLKAAPPGPDASTTGWSARLFTHRDARHRVGLAFSGGGIRSATFNLGVLQGLQELDLLRQVDYLSTVSGGGFIGSWLLGNTFRSQHWLGRLTPWDASISHLRSYSNYLAPRNGAFSADTWTMGISWLRNAFLIQLSGLAWLFVILSLLLLTLKAFVLSALHFPASTPFHHPIALLAWIGSVFPGCLSYLGLASGLVAAIVAVCLARNFIHDNADIGHNAPSSSTVIWFTVVPSWVGSLLLASVLWSPKWDTFAADVTYSSILARVFFHLPWIFISNFVAVVVVGCIALTPTIPSTPPAASTRASHSAIHRALAALIMGVVCTGVLYLELCAVVYLFSRLRPHPSNGSAAFVFGPSLVLLSFTVSVVLWIGLSGRSTSDSQREWWTRFGAWLTMFSAASLAGTGLAIFGPWLVALIAKTQHGPILTTIKWTSVASWTGTVIGGLFAGNSTRTGDRQARQSAPFDLLAKAGGLLFIISFIIAAATTLTLFLSLWSTASWSDDYWHAMRQIKAWRILLLLAAVIACSLLFSARFDINLFSLSRFYQYRLVRCYLGATRWNPGVRSPHPFTGFDRSDDLLLGLLKGAYSGPYPILNCTLNLAGSADLALHTRHSASFSLTPKYCGADRPRVGYVPTGFPGDPRSFAAGVSLGQATAISGAAASPNMGYNTSGLVAFLLTMFNVRLGWWFPNPGQPGWNKSSLPFNLLYLVSELFGVADESRRFLNISDGGHFENLAIYELIRRRCTVIIASDAECDELLQFGGLGNVLRICDTDFGAQIEIDVKSIRAQKEGHSLAHSAVGKIRYDDGSLGYIIYLKASMTGDEDPSIAQYRATHPSFPHESTAEQFFSENQFESYRKLGQHVVRHSFRGIQILQQPLEVAEQMYDTLTPAGSPIDIYLRHTHTLEHVLSQFRAAPGLSNLLNELLLVPSTPPPPVLPSLTGEELCMCLELIQFMEDVFLDLQLDDFWEHPDNRGWAILFMRWARSPRFQQAWKETRRTYGIRFEYFCAARLGLEPDHPVVRI